MNFTLCRLVAFTLLLAGLPLPAGAEQSQDFGEYVVHYNALSTGDLTPEVAKNYGIVRSRNRALLNVTVLKKVLGTSGMPVTAQVHATATNLRNQMQTLEPREVQEEQAIYYLSEVTVTDQDVIDFDIDVTPEHATAPLRVHFRQQFFTQ